MSALVPLNSVPSVAKVFGFSDPRLKSLVIPRPTGPNLNWFWYETVS
jgi:hypothetical protein